MGFSLVIFALGVLGVVRPASLIGLVERAWRSRNGMWLAIAARAVFGILLIGAASDTRFPGIVLAIGVLALVGAATLPLIGRERLQGFVGWWSARPHGALRAWSVCVCVFGGFLAYAAI